MTKNSTEAVTPAEDKTPHKLKCGLVMPISAMDGYPAEHWADVRNILMDAVSSITDPQFVVKMVSDADDVGVIQKRIIQNLHDYEIVVVDVSGKNSNVMFELGMRLAFDRPMVIVKDDQTGYSFDTSQIEHIPYPRDLRFAHIVAFKEMLARKVSNTYAADIAPNRTSILKSFGEFRIATLERAEVSPTAYLVETVEQLRIDFQRLARRIEPRTFRQMPLRTRDEAGERLLSYALKFLARESVPDAQQLLAREDFLAGAIEACDVGRSLSDKEFLSLCRDVVQILSDTPLFDGAPPRVPDPKATQLFSESDKRHFRSEPDVGVSTSRPSRPNGQSGRGN